MAFSAMAAASEACTEKTVISGFVADTFYQDPAQLVNDFKGTGFNTLATTIVWSVVEKNHGEINLEPYYPALDALKKAGYCFIFLVDTSGRALHSDVAKMLVKDMTKIPQSSLPDWIGIYSPHAKAVDFFGTPAATLEFEDEKSYALVESFYEEVLSKLKSRYPNNITAIAPCITTECEIKYAQTGFRWQSYSELAQVAFGDYLEANGLKREKMPMMNYGNHLGNGRPTPQPLYPQMQAYREDSLRHYACSISQLIHKNGMQSMGYFGQVFALPDGIYANGVVEKLSACFDVAAIDYNFYNGHGTEFKPDIPGFLSDYALTLGYKKMLVGLYMERFRDTTTYVVDPKGYELLKQSMQRIPASSKIAGVEIGNLTGEEFKQLDFVVPQVKRMTKGTPPAKGKKVGVYASVTNFYLWEGEWSNDRQVMQDDLLATYSHLRAMPGIDVGIITDKTMIERPWTLSEYDVIVFPHVTTMPTKARIAIRRYLKEGGRAIADMQFDSYLPSGELQPDNSLKVMMGVGAQQSFSDSVTVSDGADSQKLEKQNQYVNGFWIAPAEGSSIQLKNVSGAGEGLVSRSSSTISLGFMPLLVEGPSKDWAIGVFDESLNSLIAQ